MNMHQKKNDYFEVAHRVWGKKDLFVNFYIIQSEQTDSWILVDAGLKTAYSKILALAQELFGTDARPSAIILTHGHFDHVGSLTRLAARWNVPVYAHELEMPYLNGKSGYPPPDSSVGGGMMAYMADLYPKEPIDLSGNVLSLPHDGSILPDFPEWRYLHTPGHAPGHISLWRESDKTLIAGDAFVTTRQESATAVLLQTEVISGPPKYFTCDWPKAEASVKMLAELNPNVVATGHGKPMKGAQMQTELATLASHFRKYAVPEQGRYVRESALTDLDGVVSVPPKPAISYFALVTIGVVLSTVAFSWAMAVTARKRC
jgi:glyoxylase-like metal-dependent hydrolase (beta-lactamase superfamily II)